ncbi:MAG TPA: hypothetical protein VGR56_02170 [Nitrososphaerales archaeon]|nr:hypothetical protein [Nitrososphaerales archaeon]
MNFSSFEHLEIDPWKVVTMGIAAFGAALLGCRLAIGGVLGQDTAAAEIVVALLVFYIVISTPRRIVDAQRVSQARESVLLSVASNACMNATGSRPRTLMLLRSSEPRIKRALSDLGRSVLLGAKVEKAVELASSGLASYSAASVLRGTGTLRPRFVDVGDQEIRGLMSSSELNKETKLPMFMTVCFFTPIMLLLYAVFTHIYNTEGLAELAAFGFVVIDLAFYLAASDRGPR